MVSTARTACPWATGGCAVSGRGEQALGPQPRPREPLWLHLWVWVAVRDVTEGPQIARIQGPWRSHSLANSQANSPHCTCPPDPHDPRRGRGYRVLAMGT